MSPAEAQYYHREFNYWVLGSTLSEIDQVYNRYLNSAIATHDAIQADRQNIPYKYREKIDNTVDLHKSFVRKFKNYKAKDHETEITFLFSLKDARNCIAHDSGVVTSRRVKNGCLTIRWPAYSLIKEKGGVRTAVRSNSFTSTEDDVGSTLFIDRVEREVQYEEGDRIIFQAFEIGEIIAFYRALAIMVSSKLHDYVGLTSKPNPDDLNPIKRMQSK